MPKPFHELLEIGNALNARANHRIGLAGDGERRDDLIQPAERAADVGGRDSVRAVDLDQRLDPLSDCPRVDAGAVPDDDAIVLKAIDATLDCG